MIGVFGGYRTNERELLPVDELLDVGREVALLCKLTRKLACLRFGGNLARKKQPEHAFGDDFLATWGRRKQPLAVRDTQTMEPYSLCT
jgi:hypothetical protein